MNSCENIQAYITYITTSITSLKYIKELFTSVNQKKQKMSIFIIISRELDLIFTLYFINIELFIISVL